MLDVEENKSYVVERRDGAKTVVTIIMTDDRTVVFLDSHDVEHEVAKWLFYSIVDFCRWCGCTMGFGIDDDGFYQCVNCQPL